MTDAELRQYMQLAEKAQADSISTTEALLLESMQLRLSMKYRMWRVLKGQVRV